MALAPTPTSRSASRPRLTWLELAGGMLTILVTLAAVAFVPPLHHCVSLALHGHFAAMHRYIHSLGLGGLALLLGLALAHAVIFYPSEIVTATAAWVYGFAPGLALMVGGWLAAALVTYALGRSVGRPLLRAIIGARFARLEQAMDRGGTSLLLAGRLIPVVPFALMGYAAGATHVGLWRFSWTTVLGYLPLTVAVSYLGSRAQTLSAGDPFVWVAAGVLLSLIALHWRVSRRRA